MHSLRSLMTLGVKAATLAALAYMVCPASASTFSATQSWRAIFNTAKYNDWGNANVDAGGNTYLWYKAEEATDEYRLARISPTGNVYLGQYVSFPKNSVPSFPICAPDNY